MAYNIGVANFVHTWCSTWHGVISPCGHFIMGTRKDETWEPTTVLDYFKVHGATLNMIFSITNFKPPLLNTNSKTHHNITNTKC